MRRFLLFIIMLATITEVRGQANYTYRYWFDNDDPTSKTGSTTGETTLTVDVNGLSLGQVHAMRMQVSSSGVWSSVRTLYFIRAVAPQTSATGRYWFDNDESTQKTASTVNGVIGLDLSGMKTGIHAVHYQTFASDGTPSSVRTQFFLLSDYNNKLLTCELWIDDDEEDSQIFPVTNEDIELDVSELTPGTHQLTACLYDGAGILVARETSEFLVPVPTEKITISSYGEGTFCCSKDLDLTGIDGIKAYVASGYNSKTGIILLTRIYEIPAGTGFMTKGTPGTYSVPYTESHSYYVNMFKGVLERTTMYEIEGEYTNYFFSTGTSGLGFYKVNGSRALSANRAYLQIPTYMFGNAAARTIKYSFVEEGDNATGIDNISKGPENDPFFNIYGQKVETPHKGIYIHKGKKIVIH